MAAGRRLRASPDITPWPAAHTSSAPVRTCQDEQPDGEEHACATPSLALSAPFPVQPLELPSVAGRGGLWHGEALPREPHISPRTIPTTAHPPGSEGSASQHSSPLAGGSPCIFLPPVQARGSAPGGLEQGNAQHGLQRCGNLPRAALPLPSAHSHTALPPPDAATRQTSRCSSYDLSPRRTLCLPVQGGDGSSWPEGGERAAAAAGALHQTAALPWLSVGCFTTPGATEPITLQGTSSPRVQVVQGAAAASWLPPAGPSPGMA